MARPSPSYTISMRVKAPADLGSTGRIVSAINDEGGLVVGMDTATSTSKGPVLDITVDTVDADHGQRIADTLNAMDGVEVLNLSDSTFLMHMGGKIEIALKAPIKTRRDLSRAYTPGVARVCMAIAESPEKARPLTIKRNTVAVVTDGTAVLGLGDIGPAAALPVMEGKAALFKQFADVDAWPVCLDTKDTEEIISIVKAIAPVYGGINLEDIAAPRCFEIEERLKEELDIPVFHDDQHGTAIVVLAALINALKVVDKKLSDVRIVVSGAGAAGTAIMRLLVAEGAQHIIAFDSKGVLNRSEVTDNEHRQWLLDNTNKGDFAGNMKEALVGADVFIGISAPNILTGDDIAQMAPGAIVFALANPTPEVDPIEAAKTATVVATGRSDYPNQINNVLAFPGLFRGLLDAGAHHITTDLLQAAAEAIADVVSPEELSASFIIPGVFDPRVAEHVAAAVRKQVAVDAE